MKLNLSQRFWGILFFCSLNPPHPLPFWRVIPESLTSAHSFLSQGKVGFQLTPANLMEGFRV